MDLGTMTLGGLVAIGVVNFMTMWKPDIDSRIKFLVSAVAAFVVTFIPPELGNVILEKAKEAIMVAFAASGTYRLATKAGGE